MDQFKGYDTNIITNMVIASLIGVLITNLSELIKNLFSYIQQCIQKIYTYIKDYNKEKIKGEIVISSTGFFSPSSFEEKSSINYQAVMYQLKKNNINTFKIRELYGRCAMFGAGSLSHTGFILDTSRTIIIDPKKNIKMFCDNKNLNPNEKSESQMKIYNINIYSTKLTVSELNKEIDCWIREYNEYIKQYVDDGNLYYFSLKDNPKKVDSDQNKQNNVNTKWNSYKLVTYKTFDNIYFKEKDIVLQRLNSFLNNQNLYIKRGIPHTLGFLFYGKPGCGKTSCSKAIANYTKRHVVEINLSKIKTCGEFIEIFMNDFLDTKYIPSNKKIIVLEDIDAMVNIVKKRQQDEFQIADLAVRNLNEVIMKKHLLKEQFMQKRFNTDDELNLSCILNTIDGLLEQQGRILIISTNYPEKLDSALLRPGRIDLKVEFSLCNKQMILDLFKNFYMIDKSDPLNVKLENMNFKEDVYTPAELLELCFKYENDRMALLEEICL